MIPATLAMMSIPPKASTVRSIAARQSTLNDTSPATAMATPPVATISADTASAALVCRSMIATLAPSRANNSAVARPMPDAPPVTRARLPDNMSMLGTS